MEKFLARMKNYQGFIGLVIATGGVIWASVDGFDVQTIPGIIIGMGIMLYLMGIE